VSYSSQIETVFSGPSVTGAYPPHNGLAVGPNYIVMVEGSRTEWTNLAGGSPTRQSAYDFFSSQSPRGGVYDPRSIYDSVNQRLIVIVQSEASGSTISDIDKDGAGNSADLSGAYDMRYPNPWNLAIRAMTKSRIRELFPSFELQLDSSALLPPVARRLGPLTDATYRLRASISILRSHYIDFLPPNLAMAEIVQLSANHLRR
jgi:hypothetical protein